MVSYNENHRVHSEIFVLVVLCMLLEATLIVSDILTFKVASFFSIIFTIPALLYPLTYAIGDTLTEAYGRRITLIILSTAIFIEVICDLLISYAATVLPVFDQKYFEAFNYSLGKMYIAALGVVAGSILGFIVNTTLMYFLKTKFSYRSFPIRSVCSSLAGEVIFTITAFSIWFYSDPTIKAHDIMKLILSSASLKVFFAIVYSFPAYWTTSCLIKRMTNVVPLKISNVVQLSDKKGNSIFEFQIAGKRVGFSAKSKKVTLNMFYALSERDQNLIQADLKGKITIQLDNWIKSKHESSIDNRWNGWDRFGDSGSIVIS